MNFREPILVLLLMVVGATTLFTFFHRQLAGASLAFGTQPEVLQALSASLEDQRQLARLDPAGETTYRQRFDELETTLHRLQILEQSREELTRRYELLLLGLTGLSVLLVAGGYVLLQARQQARLNRVDTAITALAEGRTDLKVGIQGRDTAGRIAAMIERTSKAMALDRQRLAALRNLSAWQEASRRQAHEMRTPLTGLQLELDRLDELLIQLGANRNVRDRLDSARQELARLADFTTGFAGFARLPEPKKRDHDLVALVAEFIDTYREAWPAVDLRIQPSGPIRAGVDRDLLRQVLVNLCDNAAQAGAQSITVETTKDTSNVVVEVADDGGGVDAAVATRLFEPYATTRDLGQGMGLGLAISKKVLLDHGGDIELAATSSAGTIFRLTLPRTSDTQKEATS